MPSLIGGPAVGFAVAVGVAVADADDDTVPGPLHAASTKSAMKPRTLN